MKFSFDRDAMIKEISIAQEIITNKSPISIYSNVLLIAKENTLFIKATDTTVNFTTKIPVDVIEEGSTTVLCDRFMSILTSSPSGEIEFNQQDTNVTIRPVAKKIKFQLRSKASEKFPDIPVAEEVPFFEMPSKDIKEMITHTIFSVSEDPNRYFMTGVYFSKKENELIMVATDARRLSYAKKIIETTIDINPSIVPTKILKSIQKNASDEGNISIAIVDKIIFIKFGNYEFSSRLIDGQYPNYSRVIPENQTNSFQVNKSDLEEALKRIETLIDKKAGKIILRLKGGVLNLTSPETENSNGSVDEDIPCRYAGEEIAIGLYDKYLIEPLKYIETENVVFEFSESMKAVTLRPEPQGDYFHIIMPMSI